MKFRDYLINEDFLTATKNIKGGTVEIFENPSRKEMREAMDKFGLRFIADSKNKKVYVWKSSEMLHSHAWTEIKKETGDTRKLYKTPELLTGQFKTKAISDSSGFLHQDTRNEMKSLDWSWTNRWFDLTEVINRL